MEADNEEKLINYLLELSPSLNIKFEPLFDSAKFIEMYRKMKK